MAEFPSKWIEGNESAKEMLGRLYRERPTLFVPPLHRVPLRVGNVVEVVGPSPSAKTQILIQAAISCILPKEWNGIQFGGLERPVMFVDLDCRFDILRLSQSLHLRIMDASGFTESANASQERKSANMSNFSSKKCRNDYDKDLFEACLRRFLYIRCYNSFEFLATLKTMRHKLQNIRDTHNTGVHLLMIDSIGAFYWTDRTSSSLPHGRDNRKTFSLQYVSETVVQEIRKLLLEYPMLVLATKTASLGDKYSAHEVKRDPCRWSLQNASYSKTQSSSKQYLSYREYMPSAWQSFVTHRILVRASDDGDKPQNQSIYKAEWLLPSLNLSDTFIIRDAGVFVLP